MTFHSLSLWKKQDLVGLIHSADDPRSTSQASQTNPKTVQTHLNYLHHPHSDQIHKGLHKVTLNLSLNVICPMNLKMQFNLVLPKKLSRSGLSSCLQV